MGKKGAVINSRNIKGNYGVRDIFPRRLVSLFCQEFLQCVKPEADGWTKKLEAYPAINFRL
jgi:hypothetical protein